MGIAQTGQIISIKIGYRTYNERSWQVACDYCNKRTERAGNTAGEASDAARFEGYCVVKTGLTSPCRWACAECQAKRIAAGKASAPVPMQAVVKTNGKVV